MSQQLQTHLIAAAIGATIGVISAASIFIYQKVLEKQQHAMKTAHLDEVDRRLAEIQAELERLRAQQSQQRKKKLNRRRENDTTYSTKNDDTDVDAFSTATDIGDDEFFDCSDSENGISDIENSDFLPIAEKIQNGYRFKEHVINALEIDPNDADLHHLLGRFRYEVANLGWIERKVAATLFSEPPSASYEDAIESFQSAEKFSTEANLENQLFLSKCYIALSKYELACDWLEKICDSSVINKNDEKIQNDARQLFNKYSGYRL
ncbi:hypothetical protein DMN91_000962 [Ooceraea biroi]|uniref:Regulator of microtubule dynamics protein 1 n=1 Tax=Ooceraea biroi TaxID=2015173 RepID=A0A3L8E3X2_OOCBI|nr:hypothetical protein DMN91_000962 [Ooceraea biroi]